MSNKIVVFDFDETLGSFGQLFLFWKSIIKILKIENKKNQKIILFELLDLYPKFLRPLIIDILKFVLKQKKLNNCKEVLIYTNNSGPINWCKYIVEYLNYKTDKNTKVIDKIIKAFIVNGKQREKLRTSTDKSIEDLIKYTKYSKQLDICFIDDQEHENMINDNVYYINVLPYKYSFDYNEMAEQYYNKMLNSNIIDKNKFLNKVRDLNKSYIIKNINKDEIDIHPIISKHLLKYLDEFFNEI